jgi:BirA family biotin operon repressor/biotin-[acetyl-CoA-carboxylase] ligase
LNWRIHHRSETVSTNIDARSGGHGDVFTAAFQSSGRGRLDHRWLSPPGANLLMSAVLDVGGIAPEEVATFPLVVGLAVVKALPERIRGDKPMLKWPNDVLLGNRKLAGILCERRGDVVIAGIGVNVKRQDFAPEIAARATFLGTDSVSGVRDLVLGSLGAYYGRWREGGFAALHRELEEFDCLRGRTVTVRRTDDDAEALTGECAGIMPSGALDVGGREVFAGEAHVEGIL